MLIMKLFNSIFCLYYVLHLFDSVFCGNVYEKISGLLQDSEVVDPYSLYYNRHAQVIKIPQNSNSKNGNENSNEIEVRYEQSYYHAHCKDRSYEVFARRLINILLKNANFKLTDDSISRGKLDLEASIDELELLKSFGEGKISIRDIDGIITNVIRAPEINLFDEALNYTERISFYIYEHRVILGTVLFTIFVILIALKVKWTRWRIILLIIDSLIIISFVLTWWELLQESEIKLLAQQRIYSRIPDECMQDKINFFRSLMLFFGYGKGDCLKYYEAIMTDPVLKVTPLVAFSHMCCKMIFYPLAAFSTSISHFIENVTNTLPFWLQPFVKLILVLMFPIIIFSLLFIALGGAWGIKIGPLFHIYIHGRQATLPSNALDASNRKTIEIIQSETLENSITPPIEANIDKTTQKKSPKTAEKSTQIKEIQQQKCDEPQESDTNSDEFLEENEYERICKNNIESEMSHFEKVEEIKNESLKKETTLEGVRSRNKKSLEI